LGRGEECGSDFIDADTEGFGENAEGGVPSLDLLDGYDDIKAISVPGIRIRETDDGFRVHSMSAQFLNGRQHGIVAQVLFGRSNFREVGRELETFGFLGDAERGLVGERDI
jgi:hypothetical protein